MSRQSQNLEITFKLPYTIIREDNLYVSYCPVLDVYSQGYTEEEAVKNLHEALSLFLLNCFERGVLEEVMKESGFVPAKGAQTGTRQKCTLEVPLPFMAPAASVESICPA